MKRPFFHMVTYSLNFTAFLYALTLRYFLRYGNSCLGKQNGCFEKQELYICFNEMFLISVPVFLVYPVFLSVKI